MREPSSYSNLLRHPQWQKKRLRIMERDGFKCGECGSETKTLNVHHDYYKAGAFPWEYPDEALKTLCQECHEKLHTPKPDYAPIDKTKPSQNELWLIKILICGEDAIPTVLTHLNPDWITNDLVRCAILVRICKNDSGQYPSAGDILGKLPNDTHKPTVARYMTDIPHGIKNVDKTVLDLLTKLRNQSIDREIDRLKQRIGDPNLSEVERFEIPDKFAELRKIQKSPITPL